MAIRSVVTRGFGNGSFSGTIPLVALRGYLSLVAAVSTPAGRTLQVPLQDRTLLIDTEVRSVEIPLQLRTITVPRRG